MFLTVLHLCEMRLVFLVMLYRFLGPALPPLVRDEVAQLEPKLMPARGRPRPKVFDERGN